MIVPDTTIRILKSPLQLDNKNQITFNNAQEQQAYFLTLPYLEIEKSYYQRDNSAIYYPDIYDNLIEYNYCMYQNSNYNNKWFFAFITGMKYISDNTTQIDIVEDVYQTWCFDINWKSSFVEREMLSVTDDVPRCKFDT